MSARAGSGRRRTDAPGDPAAARPQGPGAWGLRGCTVRFGGRHGGVTALHAVDLAVPRGEVTAVVGGDGAGKTTLLRTLAGRVVPREGRVDAPERGRIGFMPTTAGVWRDLSVDENVEFVGRAYRMSGAGLARRRSELLGRAGLLDAGDRLGGHLSGGMRQKLGFCLAMVHEPDLLILDEPSTGVDPVSRVELWRMITEVAAQGRAVLMATTYLDEAERASSVLVLDEGHALYQGRPDEIDAAVPGAVVTFADAPRGDVPSWRRGRERRAWYGTPPAGATVLEPDLEDAVIALTIARGAAAGGV